MTHYHVSIFKWQTSFYRQLFNLYSCEANFHQRSIQNLNCFQKEKCGKVFREVPKLPQRRRSSSSNYKLTSCMTYYLFISIIHRKISQKKDWLIYRLISTIIFIAGTAFLKMLPYFWFLIYFAPVIKNLIQKRIQAVCK